MLDPKNLEALFAMGGIEGLLRGLSKEDASTRIYEIHEKLPEIVLTERSDNIGTPIDDRSAFAASFDDPKCVYGKDILLTRISKTFCS